MYDKCFNSGKFVEPDKKKRSTVHCKLCPKVIKFAGNTTNLRYHLELNHKAEFAIIKLNDKSNKPISTTTATQPSVKDAFLRATPMPTSSPRWNLLTKSVCYFIAKDMQPIDTVNDVGFRQMMSKFEPRYTPPDRKTMSTKYLPQMYETERSRVKQLLCSAKYYACTTDLWTSRAQHAYISLTVHYLDDDFLLKSHLLETKEFPDSHTGVHIAEELKDILQDWSLSLDNNTAFTTDNGSNVVSATNTLQCTRLPCFSHCLNLAVEKACSLSDITKALARCRRLVTHFNHSSKSSYVLKQKQEDLHHPKQNLIQDVSTRWHSGYYMVSRVLQQQQPLCAALLEIKKTDLMPSDTEFSSMEVFVQVMKPLVTITEAIGAEKWVTISTVKPVLYKLLQSHLVNKSDDNALAKRMKSAMLSDLQMRYSSDDITMLLSKAAFLDPRLKALPFLPSTERDEVSASVKEEAVELAEFALAIQKEQEVMKEPPTKKRKGEHELFKIIDDIMNPEDANEDQPLVITNLQKANAEVTRYSSESSTSGDPLAWWKANSFRYPILCHVAKKYLCVPATSVPSERAFSSAGHIVNKKRACLHPSSVNMLVFLSENLQEL